MEDPAVPRRRRFARRRPDPQDLVVSTIAEHAESLLRVARRHTACPDDAEDAYQALIV
jgi:DNA-directed RNA polymerase specialized sigma24 family protein